MSSFATPFAIHLPGHQMQRLVGPVRVRTESGLLWITVDGEPEDILLAAGESRHFEPDARVIVYALGDEARLEVLRDAPRGIARVVRGWAERLTAWMHGAPPALGRGA